MLLKNRKVLTLNVVVFEQPPCAALPVALVAAVVVLGVDTGSGILYADNRGVVLFTTTISGVLSEKPASAFSNR